MKNNKRLAAATLLLLIPPTILICSGIFGFTAPQILISPPLVIGGLFAALLTNLLTILRLQAERDQSGHLTALTFRVGLKTLNLAVAGLSCLLLGTLVAYAFVENFRPR